MSENEEATLMEFEDKLKQEFKSAAEKLERPIVLDRQIEQLFTSYLNGLTIEIYKDSQHAISQAQSIKLTEDIRNQLSPGESAFVYIADLDKKIGDVPSLGFSRVTNPQAYSDYNQWKKLIEEDFVNIKLPTRLPDGFAFIKGEIEGPLGELTYENELKYYMMLKERAITANEKMTWEKAVPEDNCFLFKTPRLLYSNQKEDQIEVRYFLVSGDKLISVMPNPEKFQIGDFEAYYSEINLPEIGVWKEIRGYEHKNGQTYSYCISTQSSNVTKEDLLLIANNLK